MFDNYIYNGCNVSGMMSSFILFGGGSLPCIQWEQVPIHGAFGGGGYIMLEKVNMMDPTMMYFSNIHYFENPMGRLTSYLFFFYMGI